MVKAVYLPFSDMAFMVPLYSSKEIRTKYRPRPLVPGLFFVRDG